MIKTIQKLKSCRQTGREMYGLTEKFFDDIPDGYTLAGFFDRVRKIKYRRDPSPVEVISRPAHSLKYGPAAGIDCKKKSILMGSWLKKNGYKYRYVAVSQRPDKQIHHVFPQYKSGGQWFNADATYADYRLNEPKTVTRMVILKP